MPHLENNTYDAIEQYVQIDLALRAQLQVENGEDISHFKALPKIIPTKKKKRQQPLLDFTHSRIPTLQEYITAMEQVLSQCDATAIEVRRKKNGKKATKEQNKNKYRLKGESAQRQE